MATVERRSPATHELSNDERGVVKSYIDAHERNDLDGLMSLLRDDLRFAMLPEPGTLIMTAKDAVDGWVSGGLFQRGYDDWRCIATTVNRMPAAVLYLRTPDDPEYRLFAIAVLHIVDGKVEITRKGRKVAMRGRGEFVGEIALLEQTPRTATVTANTPLRVFVLTDRVFRSLLDESPSVERKVLRAVARRVVELSKDPTVA